MRVRAQAGEEKTPLLVVCVGASKQKEKNLSRSKEKNVRRRKAKNFGGFFRTTNF